MPIKANLAIRSTAPFRFVEFKNRDEFDAYLKEHERMMGNRWLYEQSLASQSERVILAGTCGLCLDEVEFTSFTEGGEATATGRVPNWREGMACNCDLRLINRQRALLHYLLDSGAIEPWMRVLGLGDMNTMQPVLEDCAAKLTCGPLALIQASWDRNELKNPNYHLVISVEQLNNTNASKDFFTVLSKILAPGGRFVFTARFDPHDAMSQSPDPERPCNWSLIPRLLDSGFISVKACLFWSEEFGYLGPRNFIFVAHKI